MIRTAMILTFAVLWISNLALAADGPALDANTPTLGTMPQIPDVIEMINKATTANQQKPAEWSTPVKLALIFTLLALIPSLLAMMTSFTRIVIVLGFVRRALGTQNIPPNTVIMGLALFLTLFTMAPTLTLINEQAIQPYLKNQMDFETTAKTSSMIIKQFMLRQTRKSDLALFVSMAKMPPPANAADLDLHIVTPAFVISEFRTSFEIGCLLFIPFLLLDLVISSILLSAGMMMLPPAMISLPFKLILFILVDGWGILAQGLSLSFR